MNQTNPSGLQPEGNYYNKYESKNPIAKLLLSGFFKQMELLLNNIQYETIYEAGCGEGYVTRFLGRRKNIKIAASDLSERKVAEARLMVPDAEFTVESIYEINQTDNSFDLVLASEVLEHLEHPEVALRELLRISKKYVFVSVPNEPIWRVCNIFRGQYLKDLGNTPGHIQHWSKDSFTKFVGSYCTVLHIASPFPWTMLLCKKGGIADSLNL